MTETLSPRAWPYWSPLAAVAYSQNSRHNGRIYRFDGWTRVRGDAGHTGGGGAWSRPRYATAAARGRKTLWLWPHEIAPTAGRCGP